jgi:amidohydrolase
MKGTVRSFDPEVRKSMPERMERILAGLGHAMRFEYELKYHWSYPPTVNDPAMNDVVREVGRATLGADKVVEHDIVMWAEDMAFMQEQRPGAYFIVGARGGDSTSFPHHNARFDIDERALDIGYATMVALGLRG